MEMTVKKYEGFLLFKKQELELWKSYLDFLKYKVDYERMNLAL